MTRLLYIATISNDLSAYARLRESMAVAGFTEESCRFELFDNSTDNRFDPFDVLRELPTRVSEPYLILCHQDLIFTPETTFDSLLQRTSELEQKYTDWAVAGCAGRGRRGEYLFNVNDPNGRHRVQGLPSEAISLDEMFLLLKRSKFPTPTPGLRGFHFYGTDVAINAKLDGHRALVIDFPLTHLSAGNTGTSAFMEAKLSFEEALRGKLLIGVISTTCTHMVVSRWRFMEWLLRSRYARAILPRLGLGFVPKRR
jgi:hypothetical protein